MDLDSSIGEYVIRILPPSMCDVVVGNLFVKHYEPHDIVVIIYASTHHLVRILHSKGKIEMWDYDACRGIYRSVG